ncbi:MAG TPA: DUF2892 domain-containing protein [Planctomycetaceae bacterium]|nr:DUF2892 domain-containing protein [Planctomycetaceae bacterium]
MLPTTSARVPLNTDEQVNRDIHEAMRLRVTQYRHASPNEITRRLQELDEEWDIERTLEANAATVCVASVALGLVADRRWFVLPAVVGGFLLQHALQGWCPPLPVFRRLGVRTQREIEEERFALKVLRGDFNSVQSGTSLPETASVMSAVAR